MTIDLAIAAHHAGGGCTIGAKRIAVEHWYRHRTEIENITSLCSSA